MKITGIEIGEYRQFKDIQFDFTYPEGHPKAGKPLEKVCFIGQSGTGKTTLLNVIWDFFQVVNDSFQRVALKSIPFNNTPHKTFKNVTIKTVLKEKRITLNNNVFQDIFEDEEKELQIASSGYHWLQNLNIYYELKEIFKDERICLYVDEEAVNSSKRLLEERDLADKNIVSLKDQNINIIENKNEAPILKLSNYSSETVWSTLLKSIDIYDNKLKQFAANLVSKNSFSENRLISQIRQWQHEHPNPRVDIAENCLNRILKPFHLEVDTDGTESRLVLKTYNGRTIPGNILSTGSKQLLTTSVSIYKSDVAHGTILFDEPERSLFPDIQRELIRHYTSLVPNAQFFFATHSPIIAAAFEPFERFILYFDENGEVKCHKGIAPIGDDPNDVLRQDFGMSPLMSDEGLAAYQRYLNFATKIKNEPDIHRKMELIAERSALGNKYNFAITSPDETN